MMRLHRGVKLGWALAILAVAHGDAFGASVLAGLAGVRPACVTSKSTAEFAGCSLRRPERGGRVLKLRGGGHVDFTSPRTEATVVAATKNPLSRTLTGGAVAVTAAPLVVLVAVWYIASVFAITTSKLAMQVTPVPFTLCLCQFLVATSVSRLVLALSPAAAAAPKPLQLEATSVWKVAASYTFGFMCVVNDLCDSLSSY